MCSPARCRRAYFTLSRQHTTLLLSRPIAFPIRTP